MKPTQEEDNVSKSKANDKANEQEANFARDRKYSPSKPLAKDEKVQDRDIDTHAYNGPNGQGFTIIRRISKDGEVWEKIENHGSEIWREQDWTKVSEVLVATKH